MNISISYIFLVSIAAFVCILITTGTLCLVKKHTKEIRLNTSSFLPAWQFAISKRALMAAGIMTVLSFAVKSLRFLSFSYLIHMVFADLSLGLFLLLPHPFLNWLFD